LRPFIVQEGFEKLEAKLLSIGGKRVCHQPEPHLALIVKSGRLFHPTDRKMVSGQPSRCHQNAALYYARSYIGLRPRWSIVTGYALAEDGCWRQHSWCFDGRRVIETTCPATLYFGVILTPEDAVIFVAANLVAKLPGYPDCKEQGENQNA
jgi:hypothetical protein